MFLHKIYIFFTYYAIAKSKPQFVSLFFFSILKLIRCGVTSHQKGQTSVLRSCPNFLVQMIEGVSLPFITFLTSPVSFFSFSVFSYSSFLKRRKKVIAVIIFHFPGVLKKVKTLNTQSFNVEKKKMKSEWINGEGFVETER